MLPVDAKSLETSRLKVASCITMVTRLLCIHFWSPLSSWRLADNPLSDTDKMNSLQARRPSYCCGLRVTTPVNRMLNGLLYGYFPVNLVADSPITVNHTIFSGNDFTLAACRPKKGEGACATLGAQVFCVDHSRSIGNNWLATITSLEESMTQNLMKSRNGSQSFFSSATTTLVKAAT